MSAGTEHLTERLRRLRPAQRRLSINVYSTLFERLLASCTQVHDNTPLRLNLEELWLKVGGDEEPSPERFAEIEMELAQAGIFTDEWEEPAEGDGEDQAGSRLQAAQEKILALQDMLDRNIGDKQCAAAAELIGEIRSLLAAAGASSETLADMDEAAFEDLDEELPASPARRKRRKRVH